MTARWRIAVAIGLIAAVAATALWAASGPDDPTPPRPFVRRLHVRVWDAGAVAPSVSVKVPVVLVTAVLKVASITGVLDRSIGHARCEARPACPPVTESVVLRGRDVVALWTAITEAGPATLVSVEDGDGGRVQIRVD
jgi:hypothetical protein